MKYKVVSLFLLLTVLLGINSCTNLTDTYITNDAGTLPGNVCPSILYLGNEYIWDGMSTTGNINEAIDTRKLNEITTILPKGYSKVGELKSVYYDIPQNDLDFAAAFKATGVVFADDENPNVIIVLMTTEWFSAQYVRFIVRDDAF